MTRRFQVFVNVAAGSIDDGGRQTAEISEAFRGVDVEATVVAIDPAALADAMRAAWATGIDAIVVAGGDGTVNGAAGVAVECQMVLGVLPAGTFNHFAKDLGMTADLSAAVEFLAEAEITAVDVGEVNDRVFVNNASIGVYPQMVTVRDAIRERRGWGKIRAVPVAVMRTLRRLPTHRLRLELDDGKRFVVETSFLFVGNGVFDGVGGGVGGRASLSEHRLGVYLIAATRRWRLVYNAVKARFAGVDAAPDTQRHVATTLKVDCPERSLVIAVDGEPITVATPLRFRSRAGALRMLGAVNPPGG